MSDRDDSELDLSGNSQQTTRKSATLMHSIRSYHETRRMLDASKKMNEDSTTQVNRSRLQKGFKDKKEE